MSYQVKAEPVDSGVPPATCPISAHVKPESSDLPNGAAHSLYQSYLQAPEREEKPVVEEPIVPEPMPKFFNTFTSADEIQYLPEEALKEGLLMAKSLKESINRLELGNKRREEVWERELKELESQGAPTTLIAVCGATGAGKSSILNAILDSNIVPTSGMRACTAVVTEISYHKKSTIDAEISFLSEHEWRQELEVLMDDLVDEDGKIKRATDLSSDAGVAWHKVHAVYPTISQNALTKMTADEIVRSDQNIARMLGTTKNITAPNEKTFSKEIAKYIDSKDKKKSKDKEKKEKKDSPAFWPLIKQVKVHCKARALSTGAVLVDLPGVADANAARNNIAKSYMKKCDCIWVLAPITRAVDDKTARDLLGDAFKDQLMMDGNYDDTAITFIASKCDDISCSEIIQALMLDDDPELEEIDGRLAELRGQISEWKKKKFSAEKNNKDIEASLKSIRSQLGEDRKHLEAVKNGDIYQAPKKPTKKLAPKTKSKKRKNSFEEKSSPKKRSRMTETDDADSFIDDDGLNEEEFTESDDDSDGSIDIVSEDESGDEDDDSDASDDDNSSKDSDDNDESSDADSEVDEDVEMQDQVSEESLKAKIEEGKSKIKSLKDDLTESKAQKRQAVDNISKLTKRANGVQREKNAFCAKKRSEFSRAQLKDDFRTGLKDMDDAAAEKRDPDNFDPSSNLRDYDAIDLPVFTCSSRDYIRLKGQVKGDGDPTCFSNVADTEIPALQDWCHHLTKSSRERSAKLFLSHIKSFCLSVKSYVEGVGNVTEADRQHLRDKYESQNPIDQLVLDEDDPMGSLLNELGTGIGAGLFAIDQKPKLDAQGRIAGITPRLHTEFSKIIESCVLNLQQNFKDGLEEKCQVGAANAADAAMPLYNEFTSSMHWQTFRATLRRHGTWRRDLNVELINPFTRNIASSWGKVFESDLFGDFETTITTVIEDLVKEVEVTSAEGLKGRTRIQGQLCMEEARVSLTKSLEVVRDTMTNEQKEISRCMAPHVQDQLIDGYDTAAEERGRGSVARQKAVFGHYLKNCKDDIFEDGANIILDALQKAANAIGVALDQSMTNLAQKIEVNLSVLWEPTRDDPAQKRTRLGAVEIVNDVLSQVDLWNKAREDRPVQVTAAGVPMDDA